MKLFKNFMGWIIANFGAVIRAAQLIFKYLYIETLMETPNTQNSKRNNFFVASFSLRLLWTYF